MKRRRKLAAAVLVFLVSLAFYLVVDLQSSTIPVEVDIPEGGVTYVDGERIVQVNVEYHGEEPFRPAFMFLRRGKVLAPMESLNESVLRPGENFTYWLKFPDRAPGIHEKTYVFVIRNGTFRGKKSEVFTTASMFRGVMNPQFEFLNGRIMVWERRYNAPSLASDTLIEVGDHLRVEADASDRYSHSCWVELRQQIYFKDVIRLEMDVERIGDSRSDGYLAVKFRRGGKKVSYFYLDTASRSVNRSGNSVVVKVPVRKERHIYRMNLSRFFDRTGEKIRLSLVAGSKSCGPGRMVEAEVFSLK